MPSRFKTPVKEAELRSIAETLCRDGIEFQRNLPSFASVDDALGEYYQKFQKQWERIQTLCGGIALSIPVITKVLHRRKKRASLTPEQEKYLEECPKKYSEMLFSYMNIFSDTIRPLHSPDQQSNMMQDAYRMLQMNAEIARTLKLKTADFEWDQKAFPEKKRKKKNAECKPNH